MCVIDLGADRDWSETTCHGELIAVFVFLAALALAVLSLFIIYQ